MQHWRARRGGCRLGEGGDVHEENHPLHTRCRLGAQSGCEAREDVAAVVQARGRSGQSSAREQGCASALQTRDGSRARSTSRTRFDLKYAVKEARRDAARPTVVTRRIVNKIARYLKSVPRARCFTFVGTNAVTPS